MKKGWNLGIFLGKSEVKFNEWATDKNFPTATFFDFESGRKQENYMKIVRKEEMVDSFGSNVGLFELEKGF